MIALDSPRWHELRDAYDPAGHIPEILRRLEDDDDTAWSQLYDAFALVSRGEISEAAFAAVPHIERIANELELDDAFDHLVLAGRVAYIGLCNCAWMAPDVLEPCLRAFRTLSEKAQQLLPHMVNRDTFEIAQAILAFEQCPVIYDAIHALAGGEVQVQCPGDLCGVSLAIEPRGDGLVGVLASEPGEDEDVDLGENIVEPMPQIAFDRNAPWTEADALACLVELASANGAHTAASQMAHLCGSVACPECDERFSILEELLEPSEL